MIKSIFFARFRSGREGIRVLHQVPEGSIVPCSSPTVQAPLFDFSSVSEYIIPRQELCDRLVTVCINRFRVLGYPVCITNTSRYRRNQFIFSFALVLDEDADMSSYTGVVRKLAMLFRNLEEQDGFLLKEEERILADVPADETAAKGGGPVPAPANDAGAGGKVYALCEMILEDLNNYCECMIPIDDSNTLNLKLFPAHRPPPPIHAWHVPLSTVRLSSLASAESTSSWDLTLTRIIPYIDGISSLARIAQLADTDLNLTRKAVAHLAYYNCVILLDIFQFGAIYAPTAELGAFIESKKLQAECARYVAIRNYNFDNRRPSLFDERGHSSVKDHGKPQDLQNGGPAAQNAALVEEKNRALLVQLYASLRQGLTLKSWCLENHEHLSNIDVRRFITYGVIKGFLYRVHKYAIATGPVLKGDRAAKGKEAKRAGTDDDDDTIESDVGVTGGRRRKESMASTSRELPLGRYLDGMHCFDQICTELKLSERDVLTKLKAYGDVQVIHR